MRWISGLLAVVSGFSGAARETVEFRHENVLGTSLELQVDAESGEAARAAEKVILGEIDRLAGIFSTYTPASEFSRWQATHDVPVPVSDELFQVLRLADDWREASGGVFEPGVESLSRVWRAAAARGALPGEGVLEEARRRATARPWVLDTPGRRATRLGDTPLTLNAIAKGWIVEQAGAKGFRAGPGVRGLLLNVGGDLRHWGETGARVAIADPRADGEGAPAFTSIHLRNAALATSGNYRRHVRIGDRAYSHIIDPRSGRPADAILSASVIAPDGATADALATTLSIADPADLKAGEGRLREVDWMRIRADGGVERSPGWAAREMAAAAAATATATATATAAKAKPAEGGSGWPAGYELRVDFELNQPAGGRYARPYVAIWVEDADGFPVRTLALWLLQGGKGLRWLPDLKRWYHSDQMRALVDPRDMVATVSAATRAPGRYSAFWDGKDDQGAEVRRGRYTLFIEAAREHGTYQLIRQDLDVGGAAFEAALKGNVEIKSASVAFRPRPRATGAAAVPGAATGTPRPSSP